MFKDIGKESYIMQMDFKAPGFTPFKDHTVIYKENRLNKVSLHRNT